MKLTARETVVFAMLGAVMYASKVVMEFAPNIHLLGALTIAYTVVYRKKALYPIYTYVILNGIFYGFATWWIPYLYIWAVLWGAAMMLPQNIPGRLKPLVYMILCAAHGFLFGTLYARYQQFFLRDTNCTDNFGIENGGKKRNGYGIENVEVQKRGK